ncbi:MAG: PadR family transcriptional regulator [Aquabacterium sp.]
MPSLFHRLHESFHRHNHHHHAGGHHGRHGRRGFGGFGGRHGFGGDGPGLDDLQRGRKLGSADLQLLLLALLAERPSHGYELIKSLDERSKGYYSPSPGMVYPALTYLEEIGHASVEPQGAKKRYSITAEGLSSLEDQRATVDALLAQLAWFGQRMDEMRRAMGAAADDDTADFDAPHGFGDQHGGRHAMGTPEIRAARRSLKSALIEKIAASESEQQRIAEILERAAAEIRSGQGNSK